MARTDMRVFAAVALLLPAIPAQVEAVTADDFLEWAASAMVPVPIDDWRSADLTALDERLAGKRFVFIGEPDHFIEEKYACRSMVIARLMAHGVRHVGMEMGRSDGLRIDRFLQSGEDGDLDRVRLYALAKRRGSVPATFADREHRFLRDLRELSRTLAADGDRLHWFGFDLDYSVGGGFDDIPDRLKGCADDPGVVAFLARLEQGRRAFREAVPLYAERHELPYAGVDRLVEQMQRPADDPLASAPPAVRLEVLRDLRCLADSLRLVPNRTYRTYVLRERTMFRQFDDYVADLEADEKVVLMGHDLHLSKDYRSIEKMWPSIGSHVAARFPDQVYSIWLMYDHGARLSRALGEDGAELEVPPQPGTVENLLAKLPAPAFLLPLDGDDPRVGWLDRERGFRVNGDWPQRGLLRRQADAILFVRKVSAPRAS